MIERQRFLLDALFSAEPHAAWVKFRDSIDWADETQHLAYAEYRLLPPLCRHLAQHHVTDPLLPRFRGIMRKNWVVNQRSIKEIATVVEAVEPFTYALLSPRSLIVRDSTVALPKGVRVRIGIDRRQVRSALERLRQNGWRLTLSVPNWMLDGYLISAETIHLEKDDMRCELALMTIDTTQAHTSFGHSIELLPPAAALHDLCRQPCSPDSFVALAQVLLYLLSFDQPIDSAEFVARCQVRPILPAWLPILEQAQTRMPQSLPALCVDTIHTISSIPDSVVSRIQVGWARFVTDAKNKSVVTPPTNLPGYLLGRSNLTSTRRLPVRVWRRLKAGWTRGEGRL